jgi:hypothetical protein
MRVVFTDEDFEPALKEHGIDLKTMTEEEKDTFLDMFYAGLRWDQVAENAAWYLAFLRKEPINDGL